MLRIIRPNTVACDGHSADLVLRQSLNLMFNVVSKKTGQCARQSLTEFSQREFAFECAPLRFYAITMTS